jgi:pyridoxamine 5'-phosphate oxidase-like protein
MSTYTNPLTAEDVEFLQRPVLGFLTIAGGPTPPQPRPVWFEPTPEGTVQLFTDPRSPKLRHLHRDPRASLVAASPVGERERWVSVTGHVTIEPGGEHDLLARLFAHYWGPEAADRADELADMLAVDDWVRLVLHPETVRRVSY